MGHCALVNGKGNHKAKDIALLAKVCGDIREHERTTHLQEHGGRDLNEIAITAETSAIPQRTALTLEKERARVREAMRPMRLPSQVREIRTIRGEEKLPKAEAGAAGTAVVKGVRVDITVQQEPQAGPSMNRLAGSAIQLAFQLLTTPVTSGLTRALEVFGVTTDQAIAM